MIPEITLHQTSGVGWTAVCVPWLNTPSISPYIIVI